MDSQNIGPEGQLVQATDLRGLESEELPSSASKPVVNPFARLWSMGYRRLVPIVPPEAELSPTSSLAKHPKCRGKAVGICGPSGKWFGFNWHAHETTLEDCERWFAMGAGVGTRTGEGLVALDIDTLDETWSSRIETLAIEMLGAGPRRVGRAPKVLLPLRVVAADVLKVSYRAVLFNDGANFAPGKDPRVELLCAGRQYVTGGIHPDTGKPYSWPLGVPHYDALPFVTAEQVDAFFEALATMLPASKAPRSGKVVDRTGVDQAALQSTEDEVARLVALIPNDEPDYESYRNMAAAIRGALQDDIEAGLDIYLEWCGRWTLGRPDPVFDERVFRSLTPPFALGIDNLRKQAAAATGESQMPVERFFELVPEGSVDASAFPTPTAAPKKPPLAFVGLSEWAGGALTTRARPLIKNLLDQGAMTVLYGESNVGKTFVTMDMSFHIAMGLPWGGMKTTQKRVAYIAAEGGQGARKRGAALIAKYGHCDAFHLLPTAVDLLRADADVQPLIKALKVLGDDLGFVVIDTLSRAMAGGDENSSTDMGAVVRHMDAIGNATGAHVLVVHHTGKDRARGARGHSLLRAATDTEIEVSEGQINVTKQRDLEKSYASAFELEVVTLGVDEDGDPVTSCTLRLVSKRTDVTPGMATPTESKILQALDACADTSADPRAGVPQADLVAFLGEVTFKKDTVRVHLRTMLKKNLVERPGRGLWRTVCRNGMDEETFFEAQRPKNTSVKSERSQIPVGVFQ